MNNWARTMYSDIVLVKEDLCLELLQECSNSRASDEVVVGRMEGSGTGSGRGWIYLSSIGN
jgi:hypothetical protein